MFHFISAGHLSFECFNTLRTNPQQEVIVDVGSTSSETTDDDLPPKISNTAKDREKKYNKKGSWPISMKVIWMAWNESIETLYKESGI